jgi:hypothetical protein
MNTNKEHDCSQCKINEILKQLVKDQADTIKRQRLIILAKSQTTINFELNPN